MGNRGPNPYKPISVITLLITGRGPLCWKATQITTDQKLGPEKKSRWTRIGRKSYMFRRANEFELIESIVGALWTQMPWPQKETCGPTTNFHGLLLLVLMVPNYFPGGHRHHYPHHRGGGAPLPTPQGGGGWGGGLRVLGHTGIQYAVCI